MRNKLKWFAISFPVIILGCAIIYFVTKNRAEFNIDVATGMFFSGVIFIVISLTVWNVKSNEIVENHEKEGSV